MAHVTNNDFSKLAEAVATDLAKNNIPLNESITKLAQKMDLSQEQIRRLCEASNNATFNHMFKQAGTDSSDRMVEFPVADSDEVLGSIIKAEEDSPEVAKTAAYEMRPLRDEMHDVRKPEETSFSKVAFELRPEGAPSEEIDRRTLVKVHDHIKHEKLAADMAYLDSLQSLRARFRKLYDVTPFEQFEKEAVAVHGVSAVPHLNMLRSNMNKPEVDYNIAVITKTAGYVDDDTLEMRILDSLIKSAAQQEQLSAALIKLEQALSS